MLLDNEDEREQAGKEAYGGVDVIKPPPVLGYRVLPRDTIKLVNEFKVAEERILRMLDELSQREDIDQRWCAIGRTRIQEGFMAVARSVFQPTRLQI
jgi:hypothetical protein